MPQVSGDGLRAIELDMSQLRSRFRHATVAATIECAGNRRAEMKELPSPGDNSHEIKGLDWDAGAIGTAVWGGVLLRDVLKAAGGRDMGVQVLEGGVLCNEVWQLREANGNAAMEASDCVMSRHQQQLCMPEY